MAITLQNQGVVDLFEKGKEEWNKWVEENPDANIKVENFVFPNEKLTSISFSKFNFPRGSVVFRKVEFNAEKVFFSRCNFQCRYLFFQFILQPNLHINFAGSVFCCDSIDLLGNKLDSLSFGGASLGDSYFHIFDTELRSGLSMKNSIKGKGDIRIVIKSTGNSKINLYNFISDSSVELRLFKGNVTQLDCKKARISGSLRIEGEFKCIPDLRQSKIDHHVDLGGLRVRLKRFFKAGCGVEEALDDDDADRLCRLKEIAEQNKNHGMALAFHADEMRASRWIKFGKLQSVLDMFYSLTSNYGQSIARPFFYLALSIIMFAIYSLKQPENIHKDEGQFKTAITVSIATVTPFISISKTEREAGIAKLYGDSPPEDYGLYSYAHAGISFVFIFLIGLGLRNRFRI
ncbi:hypothetical protein [Pseudoalteromonas umbrosa]|uniref:hypothetical protein n=1 Tax=Pseudoalteromonas umbrosa TaxID=3048489 RepID=UPI0024C2F050|nr:hypothetical protein [Pseudoalteromonas sp. B95]MDK1289797.1 hypothetical protein [Pseudoalteromonas sp. B95]